MIKITKENVVQILFDKIPELKLRYNFDENELDSSIVVFDKFGNLILDEILSLQNSKIVERSFEFINDMMNSEDPEIQNLPVVGVFESLAGSKEGTIVAENLLSHKGLEWFFKVKEHFDAQ